MDFSGKLRSAVQRNNSLLCVGLDPDPVRFRSRFPATIDAQNLTAWGQGIIEQTADLVCCYKPNFAFYEQFGPEGLEALRRTITAVPTHIPVLLDVKRGDIGSTAAAYARAAYQVWRADAVTVSPYLGRDGVAPFLAYRGRMAFVLCYTSNPSASAIQELGGPDAPLFEQVARAAASWGDAGQIGLVVGATQPGALARVRLVLEGRPTWVLAPGVGAQGGDLQAALEAGLDADGQGLIIPVSRGIIYAEDPRARAREIRDQVNLIRDARRAAKSTSDSGQPARTWPAHGNSLSPSSEATEYQVRTTAPTTTEETHGAGSWPADENRRLALALHAAGCLQFGQFVLASGQQSPIYLDLRRLASEPNLLRLAGTAYARLLEPLPFDKIAAVPYAALTIGTAVALTINRPLIYPRKEVKSYGTGRTIEGSFAPGEKVVVIEDLVTSGGSVLQAIETLEAEGLEVSDVVVLVDRQQGGAEALATAGYRLHAVLTLSHIVELLETAGHLTTDEAALVREHLGMQATGSQDHT